MGDTTSGAHATMVAGELANGWRYTLPIQETRLYDGNSYEGIGLAPQIVLNNTEAGLNNGVDALLEAAMQRF
jgi:C-terminal processing protease CtpA/Prc